MPETIKDEGSRGIFELLVQSVTDYAIYMLDPQGRVNSWNAGAERFKGYSASEIMGEHFSRFYTEEDRAAGIPFRALETAKNTGRFEAEGWRVRKDGSKFWAMVVIDPIRNDAGELIGYAKVTRDMSEKRAIEEQLRQSQKMEAVGQLTGGLAHDFNNLLTGISGSLELMQMRIAQGRIADVDRYLLAAQGAVKRASALTHRLLAFSRRQTLDPKPTDVNRLMRSLEDLIGRTVGPGVEVEVVGASGLWATLVDPNQLENSVLNLCINARDAMPDGGKLTIETSNKWIDERAARQHDLPSGQYVAVCVTDTGTGMTPDDVTPEATAAVIERPAPGFAEALRAEALRHTPMGILTRGMSGVAKRTLIVNLPGSPKAIGELFGVLAPTLRHVADTLGRDGGRSGGH